jgi:predicted dithiol-disulfide oxidoreductase (DUF899 family)
MNEQVYDQIWTLQSDIAHKRKLIGELRKQLSPELISDYTLLDHSGSEVRLSTLFDERGELLIIHNMGRSCKYCTLWADGLTAVARPLADRVPFVLISPDTPEVQGDFAAGRGWTFPMLSAAGTTFIADMGFYREGEGYQPGVSSLYLEDGKIYRYAYDHFGPGDPYMSVWHFYDLLPRRVNGWQPKYEY